MTDREKLIELLKNIPQVNHAQAAVEGLDYVFGCAADHLISNGVTVRERGRWVSLTECANAGVYCSVCNKKVYKEDYAWCNRKNKLHSNFCPNCGADMR